MAGVKSDIQILDIRDTVFNIGIICGIIIDMRKKRIPPSKTDFDKVFVLLTFLLIGFGVFMIYDATIIHSQLVYGNAYKFVLLHLGWVFMGILAFLFFFKVDYTKLKTFTYILFITSIIMLVILAILGLIPCDSSLNFAPCINGANRWLYFNPPPLPQIPLVGVIGFQPSSFAKLALVLYLSFQISKNLKKDEDTFWVYLITTVIVTGLVLIQPNMSTAVIIFIIGTIIYFSSGAGLKRLFIMIPIVVALALLFILASPYRRSRLFTLIGSGPSDQLESSYHINQVSIALGSGGLGGLGFGQSRQKYQYLPEVASDSIFAIIGEEFGFIGSTVFMSVFLLFLYRGLKIALDADDLLGKMIAIGVISWIGIQFIINLSAMSRIIPLTGVPIPLISYGGSSLIFSMIGLGIVANISRKNDHL
jgi:cell division protein FtsW